MGEFDIDRIVELLDSGEFMWTDLWWHQGVTAWSPLTNLRQEVAAVKAFPPVTASPASVVSGNRRSAQPSGNPPAAQPARQAFSGWWWIVAGVSAGACVGLLTTVWFPNVVEVEKVVEKVVEKPVEVIRVVEKRIEVPAKLTNEQNYSLLFADRLLDPKQHKPGISLFRLSDKVKVIGGLSGSGLRHVPEARIVARVEAAFRNQGFRVLPKDSTEYPYTVARIRGVFLENKLGDASLLGVSGSYELELQQPIVCFNPHDTIGLDKCVIKTGNAIVFERSGTLNYGINNVDKITEIYGRISEEAANALRKAQDN
jgi:hypothetical protein